MKNCRGADDTPDIFFSWSNPTPLLLRLKLTLARGNEDKKNRASSPVLRHVVWERKNILGIFPRAKCYTTPHAQLNYNCWHRIEPMDCCGLVVDSKARDKGKWDSVRKCIMFPYFGVIWSPSDDERVINLPHPILGPSGCKD